MNTSIKMRCLSAIIIAANGCALSLPLLAQTKAPASRPMTGTVAEVNGEKISAADVERQLARIRAAQPPLQANTPEARQALQDIRGNVLESIIDWRLEVQEAKKQKLTPTAAQVDAAVEDARKQFASEAEMKAQLSKEGKSLADLRVLVTEGLMVNALESKWTASVAITEAEIAQAYRDNIADFGVPEGLHARHILVSFGVQNPTAEDKAKALKKAQDLLKKAQAPGADFGTLALQNSDDPGSKANGGDLGNFARGTMEPSFENAAFAAKVGQIVGPVESPYGYHIIKVEEKFPAHTATLEQVRPMLREPLLKGKREQAVADKMTALHQNAKIKKNL